MEGGGCGIVRTCEGAFGPCSPVSPGAVALQSESGTSPEATTALDTNGWMADDAFLPFLRDAFRGLARVPEHLAHLTKDAREARYASARIQEAAAEFVTFLDEHGARKNATYVAIGELGAGVRGFASAILSLAQLHRTVVTPGEWGIDVSRLTSAIDVAAQFAENGLKGLHEHLVQEGRRLLDELPGDNPSEVEAAHDTACLSPTLGAVTLPQQEAEVRRFCTRVLATRQVLERFSDNAGFADVDALKRFAAEICDEQQITFFETRVGNLLSRYDTWVQGTRLEEDHPSLLHLRAHVQAAAHVCAFMRELSHFHERHENDVRCEQARNRIAEIVDSDELLSQLLRFGLSTLHELLEGATPLAERLVDVFTEQRSITCVIPDGVTLHARPVSLLTRIVDHHGTPVQMRLGERACYAGSMLEVLMAIGDAPGTREVAFEGDEAPLGDIQLLFQHGLGERDEKLPEALAYLQAGS